MKQSVLKSVDIQRVTLWSYAKRNNVTVVEKTTSCHSCLLVVDSLMLCVNSSLRQVRNLESLPPPQAVLEGCV